MLQQRQIICSDTEFFIYRFSEISFCVKIVIHFVREFKVIHQSLPEVFLAQEEEAVPLYCVCTTHSLRHLYLWENAGMKVGCSSPVLWVNKPGTYQCRIKEAEDKTSRECVSAVISVCGMYLVELNHSIITISAASRNTLPGQDCKITKVDGPPYSETVVTDSYVKGKMLSLIIVHDIFSPIGDAMIFSLEDLSKVTNEFSNDHLIGKGGFGRVYRGKLRHADVAVKVLNTVR